MLVNALASIPVLWLVAYFVPRLYILAMGPQDLKKKYKAEWALVTGGSTGIGRAICDQLALQGLNVVIVALDNEFLTTAVKELQTAFPKQKFLAVPADFSPGKNYLVDIAERTKDIDVQLVFNNAGFIVTGFFDTQPIGKHLANTECNSTAAVNVSHLFASRMLKKNLRGCIVFTSSVSGYIVNPFAVIYGSTKAFMTQFAVSLAGELHSKGIDVLAVHPSPVASHFYKQVEHKIDAMESFKKQAVDPATLPKTIFAAVGRCHMYDIGTIAVLFRLLVAIIPYELFARATSGFSRWMPDYARNDKDRGKGSAL